MVDQTPSLVLQLVESGFMTFDTVVVMPCPGRCRDNLVVRGRDFCSKDTLKVGKKVKSGKVFLNTTVCNRCLPAMATRPFGDRSGWDSQGNIRRTVEWTQRWFGEPIRFGMPGQDGERLAITLSGQWLTWCLIEGYWFGKVSETGFEMVSLVDVKRFSPLSVYGAVTEDRKVVELIIGYDMDCNDSVDSSEGDGIAKEIGESSGRIIL
jgi:hypothetical protein